MLFPLLFFDVFLLKIYFKFEGYLIAAHKTAYVCSFLWEDYFPSLCVLDLQEHIRR